MIPYLDYDSSLPFGITPVGIFTALAVIVGVKLTLQRTAQTSIDPKRMRSFLLWILVGGLVSAHVFDLLLYRTHEFAQKPWSIFFLWKGMSSFGGFSGALAASLLWKRYRSNGQRAIVFADVVLSAFPIAWTIGRIGCALAHDHPGDVSLLEDPLAVDFPDGGRYDLGLLEMLFTAALSLYVVGLWKERRRTGTYAAVVCLAYAPARFGLDFLRARSGPGSDPRYLFLTPAQWCCFALFGLGVWIAKGIRSGQFSQMKNRATVDDNSTQGLQAHQTIGGAQ